MFLIYKIKLTFVRSFFSGADMTIDDRSYVMQAVATMPIFISVAYTYPRLFSLHDIDSADTELPTMLRCSIDKFTDDGAYLLGNRKLYIFFMKDINIKIYIHALYFLLQKIASICLYGWVWRFLLNGYRVCSVYLRWSRSIQIALHYQY